MYKKKAKVLRIISSLDPKFGGPSRATIDSTLDLVKKGFSVDIVTHDIKNQIFFKTNKFKIINLGPALTNYKFNLKFLFWLYKNKKKYDYFIIHGIWEFNTLIARFLLNGEYYIFTHGQLDPFFKFNFFKKIKKQIYWYLFEYNNLKKAKKILLTSEGEKINLKKTFVKTENLKTHVLNYGIYKKKINTNKLIKKFNMKFSKFNKRNYYLFLGRFHKKKGCEIIIETYNLYRDKIKTPAIFIGPFSNNKYEIYLKNLIKKYKLEKKIFLYNALYDELKWAAIYFSKAMLLASHGENFGVSIVESLSMGRPVITTNKVNIFKKIKQSNAGLISSNDVKSFSRKLLEFENLNKNDLKKLSLNAKLCFNKYFELSKVKNSLVNLLND